MALNMFKHFHSHLNTNQISAKANGGRLLGQSNLTKFCVISFCVKLTCFNDSNSIFFLAFNFVVLLLFSYSPWKIWVLLRQPRNSSEVSYWGLHFLNQSSASPDTLLNATLCFCPQKGNYQKMESYSNIQTSL